MDLTTINRKRDRLLEKLKRPEIKTQLLQITVAVPGSSVPGSLCFNPEAIYVNRKTLIELLENDRVVLLDTCARCQSQGLKCSHVNCPDVPGEGS